ncbi:MAG: DegT/DnrJ/EryC1/StrS family aminotransferase [Spirochaetales bacterium]
MSLPTNNPIPFHRPTLGVEEEAAVLRVLRSGWLTTAGEARAFEQEFAQQVAAAHALAVNSATAGLHLALEAVGVGPGDRVITTPYTFTSTAEVIRYLGADPIFVDIRGDDLNIDPAGVEAALAASERVKAIVPVHFGGHPCEMETITALASRFAVAVVEDAAHAFPAHYKGRALGTWGDAGVYSFYATKTMTTGEGGMIVTNEERLAKRMSVMRLHGIDRDVWDRYTSRTPSRHYQVVDAGYKYNLPDLLAAVGRVQLTRAHGFAERRREIARRYRALLADASYIDLPTDSDDSSWHLFVIKLQPAKLRANRDEIMEMLAEQGIATSLHYIPLHLMPYYRDRYHFSANDFPISLGVYERAISLPIYPDLTDDEVERVAATLRAVCEEHT